MAFSVAHFIAWRYLRARRNQGFIAVVAGFSFVGILLGTATLIIVMSVMNGFRHELRERLLGFNGHLTVYRTQAPLNFGNGDTPAVSTVGQFMSNTASSDKERSSSDAYPHSKSHAPKDRKGELSKVMGHSNAIRHPNISVHKRPKNVDSGQSIPVSQATDDALRAYLMALPGVHSTHPLLDRQGICLAGPRSSGCLVRGVRAQDLPHRPLLGKTFTSQMLKSFTDHRVILGHKLAQNLGVRVGDTLKILRPEGRPTAFGTLPCSRDFKVVGTFDSGMHEYDKVCLFMPLATAQSFYEQDFVPAFEVFLHDPDTAEVLAHSLDLVGLRACDWQHANSNFFQAIQIQRNVMFLILTLIVLVAVFNIVSCLIMMVKDKTRDIAILRTLGAGQRTIMGVFFLTGAWIGVTSTMCGTALGLALALNIDRIRLFLESLSGAHLFQAEIYFLSSLPSRVSFYDTCLVAAMGIGFSFFATLYPAWKASRLHPVQGLRYA